MVGWHDRLDGHECEQTLGDAEGQGSLARCGPCSHEVLDMTLVTEQQKAFLVILAQAQLCLS